MSKKPIKFGSGMQPQAPPKTIPFTLTIVFTLDGKPVTRAALQGELPMPAEGQGTALEVQLDARQFLAALEPAAGPTKTKLWTPTI